MSGFTTGVGIQYEPSSIVASATDPALTKLTTGKRFPPQRVLRHADIDPVELQDMLPSDGRIKIVVFPGSAISEADMQRLKLLATTLEDVLAKYPRDAFDVLTVLKEIGVEMSYLDIPPALRSTWKRYEIYHTHFVTAQLTFLNNGCSVFVEIPAMPIGAYDAYDIVDGGAIVVIRPDGYIGTMATVDGVKQIGEYLSGFLHALR